MKKAILVVGLPASGKTTFIKSHFDKNAWTIIDDPKDYQKDIIDSISANPVQNIVIADPHFCYPAVIEKAILKLERLGFKVDCVYFENEPIKCIRNAHKRNIETGFDRHVESFIIHASKVYLIPAGTITLSVWC